MAETKKSLTEKSGKKVEGDKTGLKLGDERGGIISNNPQNYPQTGDWGYLKPEVSSKCIGCGKCAELCPEGVIKLEVQKNGKKKAEVDLNYCKGCGLCAEVCPVKAIEMKSKR
jgi:pyruvate ferredoxin oxidoreductase delta subunit